MHFSAIAEHWNRAFKYHSGRGWMDGWMDGRTDGRTDGLMDGWMDGCVSCVIIFLCRWGSCDGPMPSLKKSYKYLNQASKTRRPDTGKDG